MNILVTGGAGFIGSRLCAHLIEQGHAVTAYDNLMLGRREYLATLEKNPRFRFLQKDLTNDPELSKTLKGIDLVCHLAANSDISNNTSTDVDFKNGTLATYNLLEAMRLSGNQKIIFASTSAIYGEATEKPTPENYGPLLPISLYGASKLAAEALITAFSHNFGIQAWIYRFANIVGPNLTHGAIFDFVKKLKLNPEKLTVLGDGTQKKSYLHVDDCISGMWFGMQKSTAPVQIFNLASEGVSEVKFLATEVVNQMGGRAQIEFGQGDRGWPGDVPYTWLDGARLKKMGWSAKLTSDEAVRSAIAAAVTGDL